MPLPSRHPRFWWWALRLFPVPVLLAWGVLNLTVWDNLNAAVAYLVWSVCLVLYTITNVWAWRSGYFRGQATLSKIMIKGPSEETRAMLQLHLDRMPNPWDPRPELWSLDQDEDA
jgi:hypothetical protein